MGLWSSLFGTDDVVKKTVDGIYNGVDAAVYTAQEKAQYFLDLLKHYEPFKLAQRLIALCIISTYLFVWVIAGILLVASVFFDPNIPDDAAAAYISKSAQLVAASKQLAADNNEILGMPTGFIVAFYFAGGAIEGVVARYRK